MARPIVSVRTRIDPAMLRRLRSVGPRSAIRILTNVVTDIARDIRDEARERVPVDEGVLKRSIGARKRRRKGDTVAAAVIISGGKGVPARINAFYWQFIEFGVIGRAPQPFIAPAVAAQAQRLDRVLQQSFVNRFEREMALSARRRQPQSRR